MVSDGFEQSSVLLKFDAGLRNNKSITQRTLHRQFSIVFVVMICHAHEAYGISTNAGAPVGASGKWLL